MSYKDDRLINSKNVKRYINGQKAPLEADFLLLDEQAQAKILKNFNASNIKELLETVTVPQLWALELAILYHLSPNELVRRVWIVREKFKSQCGADVYQHYQSSLPKILQEDSLNKDTVLDENQFALLRDDTVSIARQLQRLAYIRICRSESISERKKFIIQITLSILIVGFIVIKVLSLQSFSNDMRQYEIYFLTAVVCSGMIGSSMSMLQRMEKVSHIPPAITDNIHDTMQISLNMSNWHIVSLFLSGAIFALLVHFISLSGTIDVLGLLPNTSKMQVPANIPLIEELFIAPDNRVDLVKLLLVCFLSGFGERLIPDILDNLIEKKNKTN